MLSVPVIVLSAGLNQDARGVLSRFLMERSIANGVCRFLFRCTCRCLSVIRQGRHAALLNVGDCPPYAMCGLRTHVIEIGRVGLEENVPAIGTSFDVSRQRHGGTHYRGRQPLREAAKDTGLEL